MDKHETKYLNYARKMGDALLTLMRTKPFDEITVSELCQQAGVNRSTFYAHYSNTTELLVEIQEQSVNQILEKVDTAVLEQAHNVEVRDQVILPYLTAMLENRDFVASFVNQTPELWTTRGTTALLKKLSEIIAFYGITDPVRADYITRFYGSGVFSVLRQWVARDYADSPAEIADILIRCVNSQLRESGES